MDIIADPLYVVKQGTHGERYGPEEWQYHHWKAKEATTNGKKGDTQPSRKDGKITLHIEKLDRNMDGLSSTAFSWTPSKQSRPSTRRPEKKEFDSSINTY